MECSETCINLNRLVKSIKESENSDKQRQELANFITMNDICLSDMICTKEDRTSVFEAVLSLPNGHMALKPMLDSLLEKRTEKQLVIRLGGGRLYRQEDQVQETKVLEDLLQLRSSCAYMEENGREAIKGILRYPAMEAFVRQKWHRVRFLYFGHIWYV